MFVEVQAVASARSECVTELANGTLIISVRERAKQNRANRRIIALIAKRYGVGTSAVAIVTGHRSRRKLLSITP